MVAAAALLVASVALLGCGAAEHGAGQKFHCPMHPTYISDRPGDCPICGMRLVPIEERTAPTTVPSYVCPMHPEVTSDRPGERCSKCGMKLVPAGDGAAAGAADHTTYTCPMHPEFRTDDPDARCPECGMRLVEAGDRGPGTGDGEEEGHGAVAGMAAVELTPEGMRLAGVQTAAAERGSLARTVRTVGSVVADETRVDHFHTRVTGWVEELFVNFTGQYVEHGQRVMSIYSPQFLASQEEYLRARAAAVSFAASEIPEVRKGGAELVAAARRRLELLEVPVELIAEIERTGKPQRAVTLVAHSSGYVTAKGVFPGQQVDPSMMELFTITDLSRVWVEADFYEYEARLIRLGLEAAVTLPYDGARKLSGRVAFISPTLSADSRTLRVRFEFANPSLDLKPGMFANVEIRLDPGEGLLIPDSAVMDTGDRQVVFVEKGGGLFEPREVTVGVRSGGTAQVVAGLAAGERVVIRANFLLDSESRLRAAIAGMTGHVGHGQ